MWSPRSTSVVVLAVAALATLSPTGRAAAQHAHDDVAMPQSGLRAELIRDVDGMSQRYLGLAEALVATYAWRPAEGVRSTSEVLMHVAAANFMLPSSVGITPPGDLSGMQPADFEQVADPAEVRRHLEHSFQHLKHAIARTTDAELDATTTLFGREMTKRAVLTLMVSHMHEHLGQAIAYARVNGVTPPWSTGN
jgi:uncharacterized damage-inducible protein DinB